VFPAAIKHRFCVLNRLAGKRIIMQKDTYWPNAEPQVTISIHAFSTLALPQFGLGKCGGI
jgi:hypothetical protein